MINSTFFRREMYDSETVDGIELHHDTKFE